MGYRQRIRDLEARELRLWDDRWFDDPENGTPRREHREVMRQILKEHESIIRKYADHCSRAARN